MLKASVIQSSSEDVPRFRFDGALKACKLIEKLEDFVSQWHTKLREYKRKQLSTSFSLGEALFHLRQITNRNEFHPNVRKKFGFHKSWTNEMIKLYNTYQKYDKLMTLAIPVREMLRHQAIIKASLATPAGLQWYESLEC